MKTDPWHGIVCDWHEAPDEQALRNATGLVNAAKASGILPEGAATGKWLSVCLFWDGGRTEVEVFGDRYEIYFLPVCAEDGDFNVEDFSVDNTASLAPLVKKIEESLANRSQ